MPLYKHQLVNEIREEFAVYFENNTKNLNALSE